MGVIKNKSDQNIIDNVAELITPAKVREVNDVIDAQVEAAITSITTLTTNLITLTETVTTNGNSVPNGGTTDQILKKASNADKDTVWADAPSGGGAFLPLAGGTMTGNIELDANSITGGQGNFQVGQINQVRTGSIRDITGRQIFQMQDGYDVLNVPIRLDGSVNVNTLGSRDLITRGYVDVKIAANGLKRVVETFEIIFAENQDEPESYTVSESFDSLVLQVTVWKNDTIIYPTVGITGDEDDGYNVVIAGLLEAQYRVIITS